jgi:L-lysine 2,3-aminomutase
LALDVGDLAARGLVAPERLDELRRVAENFAVALTDEVAALIDPADPADPIAAQFVPRADELKVRRKRAATRSAMSAGRPRRASCIAIPTGSC